MSKNISYFIQKEEELIEKQVCIDFLSGINDLGNVTEKELLKINSNLSLADSQNMAIKAHKKYVDALIGIYISSKYKNLPQNIEKIFQTEYINLADDYFFDHIDDIPNLIEELHIAFMNSSFHIKKGELVRKKSKLHIKNTGSVYTLKEITRDIVENTLHNAVENGEDITHMKCLDFACGTGRFYLEALDVLIHKYSIPLEKAIGKNLFAVDIDDIAVSILRLNIIKHFSDITESLVNDISNNTIIRNALITKSNLTEEFEDSIDLANDFQEAITKNNGFDVVFSNPPYCLLKVNKKEKKLDLSNYYNSLNNKIEREIHFFRNSNLYKYSIQGMLNYYQLSIEMILNLTKNGGHIGVICPSSLFADLTSTKLRKHLLTKNQVSFIRYYTESSKIFENVSQSTVIFYMQKHGVTNKILIENSDKRFQIDLSTIKKVFPNNCEIPLVDKMGWRILSKISTNQKIKDISFIRNRRGELDLTLHKSHITNNVTNWRLVRGNMIPGGHIIEKNNEYVDVEKFITSKSNEYKKYDFGRVRLVCQQVSNIDVSKRLKFVFSKKNDIIGNSCNYIVSTRNESDLKKLHLILNSSLLNWRFKITSSNNHINNYELDELPIVDLDSFDIEDINDARICDVKVCKLYKLTEAETKYILRLGEKKKNKKFAEIV